MFSLDYRGRMRWLGQFGRLGAVFLAILLGFTFQEAECALLVSPVGPSQVEAEAGKTVTLAVSFSGAPDPTLRWYMGRSLVVTWTIGLPTTDADIPVDKKDVLRIEPTGSLTFVNIQRDYTSNYTIEMAKSGQGESSATFSLTVYEKFQNVILSPEPEFAKEGTDRFTLNYKMEQGVVQQETWFFNDIEIKTNSHYRVERQSLVILSPTRRDTGQYTVLLKNPFSSVTTRLNVTVLYGPDEPVLEARPAKPFYVSGESLSLSCKAEGYPQPTIQWVFDGQTLNHSQGVLNLNDVKTSQGGVYTCTLVNEQTTDQSRKIMTLKVYERPSGDPMCAVQAENSTNLQYHCRWSGGTPEAQLWFPTLSNTSRRAGNFSQTVTAQDNLDGKTVTCMADHPLEQSRCNITARSPAKFLPDVNVTMSADSKIAVTIDCDSKASPEAVVSWSFGSEAITSGTPYQISRDTTQLEIRYYNVSNFLNKSYSCTCRNPLGSRSRVIQLKGPSISDSSVMVNQDRTVATLTWEVPPTAIVTGFDIQIKGPDLLSKNHNGTQTRGGSNKFLTIYQKPGYVRIVDVFPLDPKSTYRFRIIPKARLTAGEPSKEHRIGPGGLSGPAIAGIAAGIPCSILFLILLAGLIYLCFYLRKNRSRQTRYPVSRAVEKAITTQSEITPHNLLAAGLKPPPDYNRIHLAPSERSVALPSFVPPPPVRMATTV